MGKRGDTVSVSLEENKTTVRVSEAKTEAFLSLAPPEEGSLYRISDLEKILEQNRIVKGIDKEILQKMIDENQYFQETLIAQTKPAVDGAPGKYVFLFNTETDNKPKILPDGSVDYSSIREVETVREGDEIVKYIPATKGQDGMDVYGNILTARPGRELVQLKGKGFLISEDKRTYTAAMTGKITYQNERLIISNLLEIDGDVTYLTGDIDFLGDVLVKGNIITSMTIKASGNIRVNGHVEGAVLYAGKDIILRNGMQGAGKGEIHCKGSVSGKFLSRQKSWPEAM